MNNVQFRELEYRINNELNLVYLKLDDSNYEDYKEIEDIDELTELLENKIDDEDMDKFHELDLTNIFEEYENIPVETFTGSELKGIFDLIIDYLKNKASDDVFMLFISEYMESNLTRITSDDVVYIRSVIYANVCCNCKAEEDCTCADYYINECLGNVNEDDKYIIKKDNGREYSYISFKDNSEFLKHYSEDDLYNAIYDLYIDEKVVVRFADTIDEVEVMDIEI